MRITKLVERKFKRVESLTIEPGDKRLVILRGPNESGKTSAIDGITAALCGKAASPEMPVTRGAEDGEVRITLGDHLSDSYEVCRTWDAESGKTALKVVDLTGERAAAGNQTTLDALLGDLTFDPLAFTKADAAKQLKLLLSAAGLESDYDRAKREKASIEDSRRETNRSVKDLTARLAVLPDPDPTKTITVVSAEEIIAKRAEAERHNKTREQAAAAIDRTRADTTRIAGEIEALEAKLAATRTALAHAESLLSEQRREFTAMSPEIPLAEFEQQIRDMQANNKRAEQQAQHWKLKDELAGLNEKSAGFDAELAMVNASLVAKLNESTIGASVPGLVIDGERLLHNGVPFEQASGMRQLELSCLIGMAANPGVRVLLIDEADKLDDGAITRLMQMATERDFQVWMTGVRIGDVDAADQHVLELANGLEKEAVTA